MQLPIESKVLFPGTNKGNETTKMPPPSMVVFATPEYGVVYYSKWFLVLGVSTVVCSTFTFTNNPPTFQCSMELVLMLDLS